MPQPDPRQPRRAARSNPDGTRQRPGPSPLAPSPTPLMPVPDAPSDRRRAQDPSHPAARGYGRDHATPDPDELVYLSGRVPRALRDEFHIQAIREQRPVVELLRDAIRDYLEHGQDPPHR